MSVEQQCSEALCSFLLCGKLGGARPSGATKGHLRVKFFAEFLLRYPRHCRIHYPNPHHQSNFVCHLWTIYHILQENHHSIKILIIRRKATSESNTLQIFHDPRPWNIQNNFGSIRVNLTSNRHRWKQGWLNSISLWSTYLLACTQVSRRPCLESTELYSLLKNFQTNHLDVSSTNIETCFAPKNMFYEPKFFS